MLFDAPAGVIDMDVFLGALDPFGVVDIDTFVHIFVVPSIVCTIEYVPFASVVNQSSLLNGAENNSIIIEWSQSYIGHVHIAKQSASYIMFGCVS